MFCVTCDTAVKEGGWVADERNFQVVRLTYSLSYQSVYENIRV